MSICANSLWNSCNSGINIEAHSLGSQQLAGHFPMRLPIEADLDLFKTKGLEELCPRSVEHSHKSHLRHPVSELVSSILSQHPRAVHAPGDGMGLRFVAGRHDDYQNEHHLRFTHLFTYVSTNLC